MRSTKRIFCQLFILVVIRKPSKTRGIDTYMVHSVHPCAVFSLELQSYYQTPPLCIIDGIHLLVDGGKLHPASVAPFRNCSRTDLDLSAGLDIVG